MECLCLWAFEGKRAVEQDMKIKIGVAMVAVWAALILIILTFFNPDFMAAFFSRQAYYFILGLFVLWVLTLIRLLISAKPDLGLFLRAYGRGLIVSLLLSIAIFASVKPYFRVLADETNLLAVSKSMTYERRVDNVTEGKWYYFNFHPIKRETEKRPLLFPFFTHLIHTLTGYRAENAFAVNFLTLTVLLGFLFCLIKKNLGPPAAYAAILLTAAQPLITQAATSAGFDLLAVLFMVICFVSLRSFLKTPTELSYRVLWVHLLMLTNIRHEGILFLWFVPAFLMSFGYLKSPRPAVWKWFWLFWLMTGVGWPQSPAFEGLTFFLGVLMLVYMIRSFPGNLLLYAVTPLLLLPIFWQKFLHVNMINPFEVAKGDVPFSAAHFLLHSRKFFDIFFDLRFYLPAAAFINWLGLAGMVYFAILFLKKKWPADKAGRLLVGISFFCLVALWGVLNSFHIGDVTHPTSSRYFCVFLMLLSVFAVMLLWQFRIFVKKPACLIFLSGCLFLLYHTVSIENRFSNTQILPRQYRLVMDFLKTQGRRGVLIITDRPGMYTVHNYGAVDFQYANQHRQQLMNELKHRLFQDIWVIQEILYKNMKPRSSQVLASNMILRPVFEFQNETTSLIRISKVVLSARSPSSAPAAS